MGVTTDSASNNITFINALALVNTSFKRDNHFRCFAHVINLSVQEALKNLNDHLIKVRIMKYYLYLYNL